MDQNTRHSVRSVSVRSLVACEAAFGVSGTRKIAQLGMSRSEEVDRADSDYRSLHAKSGAFVRNLPAIIEPVTRAYLGNFLHAKDGF